MVRISMILMLKNKTFAFVDHLLDDFPSLLKVVVSM